MYFYPRSPCGERLLCGRLEVVYLHISIHALLAESDQTSLITCPVLSYFYPRSPCGERRGFRGQGHHIGVISIHALLAESDDAADSLLTDTNAISIHALLAESDIISQRISIRVDISIHALLAESDFMQREIMQREIVFLSTLSLRRATCGSSVFPPPQVISIHALLAESDPERSIQCFPDWHFYPRSPCGERPMMTVLYRRQALFLSTLSLRRATASPKP